MLAEKLKKLRTEKGLQQKDVADNIGVSISMVSNYERGLKSPSRTTLKKLANFFNVSIDFLSSNSDIDDLYSNSNSTYEQIKNCIKEYEYEAFKRMKNKEDVTDLNRFINTLRQLDNRATYEAYHNTDKEFEYEECIVEVFKMLEYFDNLFKIIIGTIDFKTIDINKLYDESLYAIDIIKDVNSKLNKINVTTPELIDKMYENFLERKDVDISILTNKNLTEEPGNHAELKEEDKNK